MTDVRVRQIVRAEPGWSVLQSFMHCDEILARHPIIAWACEAVYAPSTDGFGLIHASADPIMADETTSGLNRWAIKRPDGRCSIQMEHDFEDEAALLAFWKKQK
jgi:hypothetical protein